MKSIHPNLSRYGIGAMIALCLGFAGCRSTSSSGGGPFLAPDRVPPPSTRALLPGQAQPYYPGDPLPAMQTSTAPPAAAVAAVTEVEKDATSRSASGRTLAWAQPGASQQQQPQQAISAPPPQPVAQASPPPVAAINEGAVTVPVDGDSLRFALPAPRELEPITPVAAAAPQPIAQRAPQQVIPQPQPAITQPRPVQLASYNAPTQSAPIPSAPILSATPPPVAPPPLIQSPWRSPQIAQQSLQVAPTSITPPLPAPPTAAQVQPLPAPPMNAMPVTLRAVPSPQPGDPIPRVRAPGYIGSQVTSTDGFRPRTSMQ
jgi:hypothetical protein